jgi:hypothetical protein
MRLLVSGQLSNITPEQSLVRYISNINCIDNTPKYPTRITNLLVIRSVKDEVNKKSKGISLCIVNFSG